MDLRGDGDQGSRNSVDNGRNSLEVREARTHSVHLEIMLNKTKGLQCSQSHCRAPDRPVG